MANAVSSPWRRSALSHGRVWCHRTVLGIALIFPAILIPLDTAWGEGELARGAGRQLQLETFDAVWTHVRDDYYDFSRIESDWIEARERFRPQAAGASRSELRERLNQMLDGIGESHFLVLPPTGVPTSPRAGGSDDSPIAPTPSLNHSTGLGVRLINGSLLIDRVGKLNGDLVKPGWELTAIGNKTLEEGIREALGHKDDAVRERSELILEASANSRIAYPGAGEELSLTLRDEEGVSHVVTVQTEAADVDLIKLGNLPSLPFSYSTDFFWQRGRCDAAISFTTWVPQLLERFLLDRDNLFACQGLIIDLRGNLGGVLTTMVPLASHLVSEPVLLGQLMREDGRIDFRAFPRRVASDGSRLTPFSGPIAILIDSMSASTSEMFTAGLQALGRARVFGTPSPGMALPAQMQPLPNGDRLMYAFADYIDGRGRRIEGIGVTPDEIIESRRSDLIEGIDPVMDAALAWLRAYNQDGVPKESAANSESTD